ncbi:MAG: adenylate kinase [Verrucomicrobiales bacterium]|jgi:adenylate kinase
MNDRERYNTFLIFGAPGSGKGTQGQVIGQIPRFFHCACGDVFRSLDTRSELGQEFLNYSSQGLLVPDELTVRLWKSQIKAQVTTQLYKPDIDFLVLDGIPRNVEQAKIMEEYVKVHRVFHLSLKDRGELARRLRKRALKDNRLDDANETVVEQRIKLYEEETRPMLEYYDDAIVSQIDASLHPAEVMLEILNIVTKLEVFTSAPKV